MQSAQTVSYPQFHSFYGEHHIWLVTWLRNRLGNASDAADLAHDTFLLLLSRAPISPLTEPRAFLSTLAHGLMVDLWRRRDVERAYLDALSHLAESEAPSPEVHAQWLEMLVAIDCLLAGLTSRARMAFLLARLEGLTSPQIATKLGVSLATIERDLAKALRQIYAVRYGT
ncbi:MAG TPA: sigma-70 family RNA polymerase sigma factor [Rhodanobacter sp.]